jgi:hypothetical protein
MSFGERETGLEPATSSLGSWHSTTELLPRVILCGTSVQPIYGSCAAVANLPVPQRHCQPDHRSLDKSLHADAPEYCRSPARQQERENTSSTAASANAPSNTFHEMCPANAWTGTVVANATGTMNVRPNLSHFG